jgi:ATP-dependent Clp protease adaptor protein ClpS
MEIDNSHPKAGKSTVEKNLFNDKKLILYDDNENSFEHVINCLVKYLKFGKVQAEQCALFVHYHKKYLLKEGSKSFLEPIQVALKAENLKVKLLTIKNHDKKIS